MLLHSTVEQMANDYSHLFFSFYRHSEKGEREKLNEITTKQDILLKQLKENGYDVVSLLQELKIKKKFQQHYDKIVVFTDGGVRNNHDKTLTSLSASAYAVYGDNKLITHHAQLIGDQIQLPNNTKVEVNSTLAEYHGLRQAQLFIKKHEVKTNRIVFLTDCKTMVQHIDNTPCIENLKDYALQLREELDAFTNAEVKHIPREHNKITDALVNQLMDMYERGGEVCH